MQLCEDSMNWIDSKVFILLDKPERNIRLVERASRVFQFE